MVLASLISVAALVSSADVIAYLREPVRIFDRAGAANGALVKTELPPLPVHITDVNGRGFPGISVGGRIVYLKLTDVETRGFVATCTPLTAPARTAGTLTARTDVGAASHVGENSVHCIPPSN